MTIAVDASSVVALVGSGFDRGWVAHQVIDQHLVAPHLLVYEAANILRRHELAGVLSRTEAALAHADLLDLPIEMSGYHPIGPRAWALRRNLTSYDASYVALAEMLEVPLVTLDRRLAGAPGLQCEVRVPPT